ncbi:MAG TPA: hypothetical protein VIY48_21650 [Candidatus Paceibacterota bacterium]
MPRKRDYKAEYARRKAKAVSLGYRSPREEYRARKSLNFTRQFPSLKRSELPDFSLDALSVAAKRRRFAEAKAWSDRHSRTKASKFRANMSNAQFDSYYRAFVEPHIQLGPSRRKRAIERKRRIREYMLQYGGVEEGTPDDARYLVGPRT